MSVISEEYRGIGQALRAAREERGLRQEDVGARLKRTKSTISKIEKGFSRTSLDFLQQYGDLVGVEVIALCDRGSPLQHQLAIRLARMPNISEEAASTLAALFDLWESQHLARAGSAAG